jgi:hypothetical protein
VHVPVSVESSYGIQPVESDAGVAATYNTHP